MHTSCDVVNTTTISSLMKRSHFINSDVFTEKPPLWEPETHNFQPYLVSATEWYMWSKPVTSEDLGSFLLENDLVAPIVRAHGSSYFLLIIKVPCITLSWFPLRPLPFHGPSHTSNPSIIYWKLLESLHRLLKP